MAPAINSEMEKVRARRIQPETATRAHRRSQRGVAPTARPNRIESSEAFRP